MTTPFPKCLRDVTSSLFSGLKTPLSIRALKMLAEDDYDQLLSLKIDPRTYHDSETYMKDAIVVNFLRKCVDVAINVDPKAEAVKVWHISEQRCARTNVRFKSHIFNGPFEDLSDVRVHELLLNVQKTFKEIVGNVPKELVSSRHGPGSTFRDKGKLATLPDKISNRPTITSGAQCLKPLWSQTAWARYLCWEHSNLSEPEEVRGDRMVFVDKTALIKRPISIGPSINTYFQLGVGSHLRRRLKKFGIDLDVNQSVHAQVARDSSKDGKFATIDLTSASDSVARELVRFLSEPTWYSVLETLRCPVTLFEGRATALQKFSAMGNGYTFELETCIFLAIAINAVELSGLKAIPGENVFVYGDDIIVPTECSDLTVKMLNYCGFDINLKKTFVEGPFRESCGGDFFEGVNVRTHFLEEFPILPSDWIKLANGIRRMALVSDDGTWGRPYLRRSWFKCLDQLPIHIRECRGPVGLGDLVINESLETSLVHYSRTIPFTGKRASGPSVDYYVVWAPYSKPVPLYYWKPLIQLASALYGVPSDGPIPRDSVSGYRRRLVPFS